MSLREEFVSVEAPRPLRDLLNGLPIAAAAHDLCGTGNAFHVNRSFTALFGYAQEDVADLTSWAERAYPDPAYRRAALARWSAIVDGQKRTAQVQPAVEHLMTDKAGRSRNVLIGFALHGDFVLLTFQDITELRQAEARERAQRTMLDRVAYALTEEMPGGAFIMLLEPGQTMARFSFVSRHFLDLMGADRDDVLRDPLTAFGRIPDGERERWIGWHCAAFEARCAFARETRVLVAGETRWVRAEAVPRDIGNGWFIWEGVLTDITRLRTTEQRLQRVLHAAQAHAWTLDLPSGLTVFNDRWSQHDGLAPVQHVSRWMDSIHPDDRKMAQDALADIAGGATDPATCIFRRKTAAGTWSWIKVFAGVSDRDATGRPQTLSGVSFDITEEHERWLEAQETQARLREDLQRAHQRETVAQVAGGLAHDLNNLIGLVMWNLEKLDHMGARDPEVADSLSQMRRAVDMSRDLIGGLEGLWHSETPRSDLDLGALLSMVRDLVGWQRAKRHDLRIEIPAHPLPIWGNPTEILQVVVNLALNGCDAGTPDRPASVAITALAPETAPPSRRPDIGAPVGAGTRVALFRIEDTGTGITEDVRARIFQPHFTTKGSEGTGLGLPIVARILQHNKASLWIETEIGRGTSMTIAWPVAPPRIPPPAAWATDRTPVETDIIPPSLLADVQALVVDDLPDVAMVLGSMLETAGAAAYCETDPGQALELLREAPGVFSVLVTDLHMPGTNGLALARTAACLDPPVPSVLVTARAEMLTREDREVFAAVLSKPVSGSQMVQAARHAIDEAGQTAKAERIGTP